MGCQRPYGRGQYDHKLHMDGLYCVAYPVILGGGPVLYIHTTAVCKLTVLQRKNTSCVECIVAVHLQSLTKDNAHTRLPGF